MHDDVTQPSDDAPARSETSARTPNAAPSLSLRFTLGPEIGRGGMGAVYSGQDQNLNREVAVKVLNPALDQGDSNVVSKFMFEAEILGQLEHPGVIPVYERGALPGGRGPFYAMKLVRGQTFESLMNALRPQELREPATISRLVAQFLDACRTVGYAHARGIVHHDLKPANIMIDEHDNVLVLDWGLAFDLNDPGMRPKEGTIAGTPAYMAPEQIGGKASQIGPQTDVFSLGCILYELLTGRRTFRAGSHRELKDKIVCEPVESVRRYNPAVSKALEAICTKALNKDPEKRYAHAKALAQDLENWRDDLPLTAYSPSIAERLQRWSRRKPRSASAVVTASAMTLVALTIAITSWIADWRYEQQLVAGLVRGIEAIHATHESRAALSSDPIAVAESDVIGQIHLNNLRVLYGTYAGRRQESSSEAMTVLTEEIGPAVESMIIENVERNFDNERYLYAHFLAWNAIEQVPLNWSNSARTRLAQLQARSCAQLRERWGNAYEPPDWAEIATTWQTE